MSGFERDALCGGCVVCAWRRLGARYGKKIKSLIEAKLLVAAQFVAKKPATSFVCR